MTGLNFGFSSRHYGIGISLLVCLFASLSSATAVAASAPAPYEREAYALGVECYRSGDYLMAMQYFSQVLENQPKNINAHYYRALIQDRLGRTEAALSDYKFVLAHGSESRVVGYSQERVTAMVGTAEPKTVAKELSTPVNGAEVAMMLPTTILTSKKASSTPLRVPLKNSRNALLLNAVLTNDTRQAQGDFIVDTGATYTSISREMAEKLNVINTGEHINITTANGRIEVPKVRIPVLNVNGLEAYNVEATVIPIRPGSSFSGLLGLSFLRQFIVTIDSEAGHLIFAKRETAAISQ